MDSSKPPSPAEGTRVDLGEDLLEPAPEVRPAVSAPKEPNTVATEDEFGRAEIMIGERLYDDAKKILRKILIHDPHHAAAKLRLDEIQKLEIQELLAGQPAIKKLGSGRDEDQNPAHVMATLEKELRISLGRTELKPVPDLFATSKDYDVYRDSVMRAVLPLAPRERIDIGVAHLEMGMHEVAITVFESVVRYEEYRVVGMYLLSLALIFGGRAIEATIKIEPFVRDLTATEGHKTDFLYLMALAFEHLHDRKKAREFYRRVYMLNPKYRDVAEKLK